MNKKKVISRLNPLLLEGIAHRGLHDEQITENSFGAFKKAVEKNVPIEFDVHLTADNELVICHDEDLVRTTGKEGIIEDLTLQEIKENYRLLNGETLPTLGEVLQLVDEKVPLVIELKVFRLNYKPLAKRVREELDKYVRDKRNYMLISFDPRSLWPFKKYGIMRSLLVAKEYEWTYMFRHTVESVDIEKVFFSEKTNKYRKYHKRHLVNCWCVDSKEDIDFVYPYSDTITYESLDPDYVKEKMSKKHQ